MKKKKKKYTIWIYTRVMIFICMRNFLDLYDNMMHHIIQETEYILMHF